MMDAETFAQDWEAAWNSHDLERILAHYRDDIVFRSQKALALVGQGEVTGKAALQAYWSRALAAQPDLRFTVQKVFVGHKMLVIHYKNHRGVQAAEVLYFDDQDLVCQAAACHAPSP